MIITRRTGGSLRLASLTVGLLAAFAFLVASAAAQANDQILRPNADVAVQWSVVGGSEAWAVLDDPIEEPEGASGGDLIDAQGQNNVTRLGHEDVTLPPGASLENGRIWFYAFTNPSTRLEVKVHWNGALRASRMVGKGQSFDWRGLAVDPPTEVAINDLTVRFRTVDGPGAKVRASYLGVAVDEPETCDEPLGTFGPGNWPPACWRPYSDTSPWNTPVGADPQLASNSSDIVAKVMSFSPTPHNNDQNVADTTKDWDHPIYFSQPSDPLFTLHFEQDGELVTWGTSPEIEGTQIRIPDEARPAGSEDAHLSVIDHDAGYEYGFYAVQEKPEGGGTLIAQSGGRTPIDGPGTNVDASAGYFPPAAGMIRPAELEAGQINHALFMDVECTSDENVYPANPNHGAGSVCSDDTNAPAIGQRFYLDMSPGEIDALSAPAWTKTILRAMAEYGMYVGDTGGSSWGIHFESGSSYTSYGYADPWIALGDQLGVPIWFDPEIERNLRVFNLANVVDWGSKLRVLAPCVSQDTC